MEPFWWAYFCLCPLASCFGFELAPLPACGGCGGGWAGLAVTEDVVVLGPLFFLFTCVHCGKPHISTAEAGLLSWSFALALNDFFIPFARFHVC